MFEVQGNGTSQETQHRAEHNRQQDVLCKMETLNWENKELLEQPRKSQVAFRKKG